MRVLFLDIDGVLNRRGTKERCNGYLGVDRELSRRFLTWLRGTDVKVVLSSTWRNHPEMWGHLREAGIEWIGVTPDLVRRHVSGVYEATVRGDEIKRWLDDNQITSYAILDDCSDMLEHQKPYFVQTDENFGIEDKHIARLNQIFLIESP